MIETLSVVPAVVVISNKQTVIMKKRIQQYRVNEGKNKTIWISKKYIKANPKHFWTSLPNSFAIILLSPRKEILPFSCLSLCFCKRWHTPKSTEGCVQDKTNNFLSPEKGKKV
jgi:hypothetical protein